MNAKKVNKSLFLSLAFVSNSTSWVVELLESSFLPGESWRNCVCQISTAKKTKEIPESEECGFGTEQEQTLKPELSSYLCASNDSTKTCARFKDESLKLFLSFFSISKHNKSRDPMKKKNISVDGLFFTLALIVGTEQ